MKRTLLIFFLVFTCNTIIAQVNDSKTMNEPPLLTTDLPVRIKEALFSNSLPGYFPTDDKVELHEETWWPFKKKPLPGKEQGGNLRAVQQPLQQGSDR